MGKQQSDERPTRVLVIDDEVDHAEVMCESLDRLGFECDQGHSLADARRLLKRKLYDVVVTDLRMDGERDGLEVLREARQGERPPPVILVTAVNDVPTSKEAIRGGAYDYVVKPLDLDDFRAQVGRAAEQSRLRRKNAALEVELAEVRPADGGFAGIVGKSPAMTRLTQTARQVARSTIPVLILGESGTGKELVARAVHNHSDRRKERLVTLNCAGLSESILEDELFGHVKGAFTGAQGDRAGRFEHADGGTLFLDEIGDMPAAMQAKLLRVLENGEVVRLGRQRAAAGRRPHRQRDQPRPRPHGNQTASSARIFTSASRASRSPCRRCASAARTSRCSCTSSSRSRARSTPSRSTASRATCSRRSCATRGRATCGSLRASWRTWSSSPPATC